MFLFITPPLFHLYVGSILVVPARPSWGQPEHIPQRVISREIISEIFQLIPERHRQTDTGHTVV